MIRVLVVDDSPSMRQLLLGILGSDPEVSVVGVATDGEEAHALAVSLRPDIITMDIRMPRMDGVAAIRAVMRDQPTPIVVFCSDLNDRTLNISFNALKAGAVEVVEKPRITSAADMRAFAAHFLSTIKLMAEVKVVRQLVDESGEFKAFGPTTGALELPARANIDAVGICSSTGGPVALEYLFRHLPRSFPAPIVVVQHITEGFLHGLVEWLKKSSRLEVCIAEDGEVARRGKIYFAPEHIHVAFLGATLRYLDDEPVRSHKPSGEFLFASLADWFGPRAMGVMLTGMGEDGADALEAVARGGGVVLAQDEESSVVYGMPRAVVERRLAREVLPLDRIPGRMVYWAYGGEPEGGDAE